MTLLTIHGAAQAAAFALAQADRPQTLPPTTRAAAQMALLGIALVGLFFVVLVLLGGRWVRRQGSSRRGPVVPPDRPPLRKDELPPGEELSTQDADGDEDPLP